MKMQRILTVATGAALLATGANSAHADYMADFDTTGSAADFGVIHSLGITEDSSITEAGSGDQYLSVAATADSTNAQRRMIVGPINSEGAEVLPPTGQVADPVRTEAHMGFTFEGVTSATGDTAGQPFVPFGFLAYDSATNTGDYGDKVIVQFRNDLGSAVLASTVDANNPGTFTIADYDLGDSVFTAGDELELQLTGDQVRLLLNGTPLTSAETDSQGYVPYDSDGQVSDFSGDSLMPFVGVIRGAGAHPAGTTLSAGFDDIFAQSVLIPEPASAAVLGLAGLALLRRRRSA